MNECEICKCKDCAEYVLDPYQKEMYDVEVYIWICDDCYRDKQGDI